MSSPKTIRLQNLSPDANLSLNLFQLRPAAHGSMKRGPMLTPILIGRGVYYDVCAQLACSYEDAVSIVRASPEVQAFKNAKRLAVIEFPPAPSAVVEPPTPAPAPAPAPVEPVEPPTPPVPTPDPEPEAPEALPDAPIEATDTEATADLRPAPRSGEPSMDWAEDELRFYADAHGIDVSKAKSKTSILRAIRLK